MSSDLTAYVRSNRERYEQEFVDFLRIPSVSTEKRYADDVSRCAEWLADIVREADFHARNNDSKIIGSQEVQQAIDARIRRDSRIRDRLQEEILRGTLVICTEGFRVALTGVAATPVLVDPSALDSLDPPGDFRGSPEYRREVAGVLTKRVIAQLGGDS